METTADLKNDFEASAINDVLASDIYNYVNVFSHEHRRR